MNLHSNLLDVLEQVRRVLDNVPEELVLEPLHVHLEVVDGGILELQHLKDRDILRHL